MPVTSYYAFVMSCSKCGVELKAGPTGHSRKLPAETLLYFKPDSTVACIADIVGESQGTGDTFVCTKCADLWNRLA